jgi:hypothetical protein
LTVAHQLPFGYTFYVYIFGLRAQDVGGVCQYPDPAHIPAENVYFASTGPDHQYNGVVLNTHSTTLPGDFVVITLDRPVVGRVPMAVRKSGFASPHDRSFRPKAISRSSTGTRVRPTVSRSPIHH